MTTWLLSSMCVRVCVCVCVCVCACVRACVGACARAYMARACVFFDRRGAVYKVFFVIT